MKLLLRNHFSSLGVYRDFDMKTPLKQIGGVSLVYLRGSISFHHWVFSIFSVFSCRSAWDLPSHCSASSVGGRSSRGILLTLSLSLKLEGIAIFIGGTPLSTIPRLKSFTAY